MVPQGEGAPINLEGELVASQSRLGNFLLRVNSRQNRWLRLGLSTLALSGAATVLTPKPAAESVQFGSALGVGFSSNEAFVSDPLVAQQKTEDMVAAGATEERIFAPYTVGQAEVNNDLARYCNAAENAGKLGMSLTITFDGYFPANPKKGHGKPRLGFIPDSAHDVQKFENTLNQIIWHLEKKVDKNGQNGGCAPDLKKMNIELGNEVNYKEFNANLGSDSPAKIVKLLSKVYPVLHADAVQPGLNDFDLEVLSSSLTSTHDPVGFLTAMAQAKHDLGIKGRLFDKLAVHLYPDPGVSLAQLAAQLYPKIAKVDVSSFEAVPIEYNEVGENTEIVKSKRNLYSKHSLSLPSVSQAQQAKDYIDLEKEIACNEQSPVKVDEALSFMLADDGVNQKDGLQYPDGSKKDSYGSVVESNQQAATAEIACN